MASINRPARYVLLLFLVLSLNTTIKAHEPTGRNDGSNRVVLSLLERRFSWKPTLQQTKIRSFCALLDYLAERYDVALVAEDCPLKTQISEAEAKEWLGSLPEGKEFPLANVKNIMLAFDYDLSPYEGNVFLLKKRFTDPLDFPCVTLPEWMAAIEDVKRLMEPFSPGIHKEFSTDERIRGLCRSFTPDQRKALRGEGILVSSLDAINQERVRAFCDFFAIEDKLEAISLVVVQARCVLNEKTRLGWFSRQESPGKGDVFGYEGPMTFTQYEGPLASRKPDGENYMVVRFRPLSDFDFYINRLDGLIATDSGLYATVKPLPSDLTLPSKDTDTYPNNLSLEEAAQCLNKSETKKTATISVEAMQGKRFVVNSSLVEKRITVAGLQRATPQALFYAFSKVYGLRVKDDAQQGVYSLERLRSQVASDRSKLWKAVMSALPESYLAMLHLPLLTGKAPITDAERAIRPYVPDKPGPNAKTAWFLASTQRLRQLLQKRIGEAKSVSSTRLLYAEKIALANSLMADATSALSQFLYSPDGPAYIAKFDRLILTGGDGKWPDGTPNFSISLKSRRKNGTLEPYAGISLPAKDLGISPIE